MTKQTILAFATLGVAGVSCARDLEGVNPPANAFYYPVSVAVSPDQRYAYVANSNFDLRFNAGWVAVVDLEAVLQAVDAGNDNPTEAIVNQVNVLSLGGDLSLNESGDLALLTHRGNPSLTLLEVNGDTLDCGDPSSTVGLTRAQERIDCDEEHVLDLVDAVECDGSLEERPAWCEGDVELAEINVADPFSSAMFTWRPDGASERRLAVVGHLAAGSNGGRMSVFEVMPRAGEEPPRLEPLRSIGLAISPSVPNRNGLGAVVPHPDTSGRYVLATGQYYASDSPGSTIYSIDVGGTLEEDDDQVSYVRVNGELGGDELYGLTFSPDGRRAFAANRSPDAVVALDTSIATIEEPQADGTILDVRRPRLSIIGATPVPDRPTGIVYLPRASGDVVLVASLDGDVVFVLAPEGARLNIWGRLDEVGLGPYSMAHATVGGRELLLVTTFFDHGLAVFDVSSPEPAGFVRIAHLRSGDIEPSLDVR